MRNLISGRRGNDGTKGRFEMSEDKKDDARKDNVADVALAQAVNAIGNESAYEWRVVHLERRDRDVYLTTDFLLPRGDRVQPPGPLAVRIREIDVLSGTVRVVGVSR
jgi:hypothetical protein